MAHGPVHSAVYAALLLFVGCASQAPPSGGPPDRTPPRVVSTVPADDSVSVGIGTVIEVLFSEPMDRSSVERSVFLSPRPAKAPRYKWKGRRLRILLEDSLTTDRTYRVSVGADGRDEFRNRMTGSYDFKFSTGKTIHRGEVSGRVKGGAGRNVFVVAFDLAEEPVPDPAARAPYVTQAGERGDFSFPGLGKGRYRVFAFEDINRDQLFNPGQEWLAVPPEDAVLDTVAAVFRLRDLKLAIRDTSAPHPLTARTVDARRIRLKMDEVVRLPLSVSIRGAGGELPVQAVYHDAADSSVIFLVTGSQTEGEVYEVSVSEVVDVFGNVSVRDTTLSVKGDGRADKRSPTVVRVEPGEAETVYARSTIVLTFDEAMVSDVHETIWVGSDSTIVPAGATTWKSPNILVFEADETLPTGDVKLVLQSNLFRDISGNVLDESVEVLFEVAHPTELGKVTGSIALQDFPVYVEARRMDGRGIISGVRIAPGDTTYSLDGLISGKYILQGYIDTDDNGSWFSGEHLPFAPAEPTLAQMDTVDVRPRWETVVETRFSDVTEENSGSYRERDRE